MARHHLRLSRENFPTQLKGGYLSYFIPLEDRTQLVKGKKNKIKSLFASPIMLKQWFILSIQGWLSYRVFHPCFFSTRAYKSFSAKPQCFNTKFCVDQDLYLLKLFWAITGMRSWLLVKAYAVLPLRAHRLWLRFCIGYCLLRLDLKHWACDNWSVTEQLCYTPKIWNYLEVCLFPYIFKVCKWQGSWQLS